MMGAMTPAEQLADLAQKRGFLTAWAPVQLPEAVQQRYRAWIAGGSHATMGYLADRVEERLKPVGRFGWARSVLVLAAAHAYPQPQPPVGGIRLGRVARYAWVGDYHRLIRPHLSALEQEAHQLGLEARGYVDHGPLSERSYAVLGGLGWIGRNAMFMRMGQGSYLTLAVLLCSAEPPELPGNYPGRCGSCTRCVTACPTQALPGDGRLEAARCISYYTLEHRGLIPEVWWPAIGDWLLGCDICQEVCPWNRRTREFWSGFAVRPELAYPDLESFFALSGKAFARQYQDTVFARPGRNLLARNALIVLANSANADYLPLIRAAQRDPNPLVQATALVAERRLWQLS